MCAWWAAAGTCPMLLATPAAPILSIGAQSDRITSQPAKPAQHLPCSPRHLHTATSAMRMILRGHAGSPLRDARGRANAICSRNPHCAVHATVLQYCCPIVLAAVAAVTDQFSRICAIGAPALQVVSAYSRRGYYP